VFSATDYFLPATEEAGLMTPAPRRLLVEETNPEQSAAAAE